VKLATDLGGGAAETEKVGELQPDDPKTNRRASRATYVFRQSPLSRAPRPFVGPVLKGNDEAAMLDGLRLPVYGADDGGALRDILFTWWEQKFLGAAESGAPAIGDRKE